MVVHVLKGFIFQRRFIFTTKLRERCRALVLYPLLSQMPNLPVINTTHQNGALVPIDESSLMYLNHAMSIIYLRFHPRYCAFCDSGQMCNYLIHHCTVAQSIFIALSILSALFIHLIPTALTHGKHGFSDRLRCFAFSRMSQSCNYIVCSFLWLSFFTQ